MVREIPFRIPVLNIKPLAFGFVSRFEFRDSDFPGRGVAESWQGRMMAGRFPGGNSPRQFGQTHRLLHRPLNRLLVGMMPSHSPTPSITSRNWSCNRDFGLGTSCGRPSFDAFLISNIFLGSRLTSWDRIASGNFWLRSLYQYHVVFDGYYRSTPKPGPE